MLAAVLRFAATVAAVPLCGRFMDGVTVLDQTNALVVGLILAVIFTVLRPVMRLIFTPARGCSSYRVTDGPRLISIIRVCTPKLDSVFTSRSALCVSSSSTPFSSVGCCLRKRLRGG